VFCLGSGTVACPVIATHEHYNKNIIILYQVDKDFFYVILYYVMFYYIYLYYLLYLFMYLRLFLTFVLFYIISLFLLGGVAESV